MVGCSAHFTDFHDSTARSLPLALLSRRFGSCWLETSNVAPELAARALHGKSVITDSLDINDAGTLVAAGPFDNSGRLELGNGRFK